MSRKYKFYNGEGIYFVSFSVVYWIDLFTRADYNQCIVDNLNFYASKGMQIFGWCIMPSHIHLIFRDENGQPDQLLGRFKSYTSKTLQQTIIEHPGESRKEWLLWMMKRAASSTSNVSNRMLWQHHNKPIELFSAPVFEQKMHYLHHNPVVAGYVTEAHHWKYSSAIDYCGSKGFVKLIDIL
ncbi:Transposase IS200 like protein [compost metagenome]